MEFLSPRQDQSLERLCYLSPVKERPQRSHFKFLPFLLVQGHAEGHHLQLLDTEGDHSPSSHLLQGEETLSVSWAVSTLQAPGLDSPEQNETVVSLLLLRLGQ